MSALSPCTVSPSTCAMSLGCSVIFTSNDMDFLSRSSSTFTVLPTGVCATVLRKMLVLSTVLPLNAVMTSPLVKTAIYGREPNWGRILAAAGRSGASVVPDLAEIWIAGVPVVRGGQGLSAELPRAAEAMTRAEYEIAIDLHLGEGSATGWTCDLNEGYVKINAGYMT